MDFLYKASFKYLPVVFFLYCREKEQKTMKMKPVQKHSKNYLFSPLSNHSPLGVCRAYVY